MNSAKSIQYAKERIDALPQMKPRTMFWCGECIDDLDLSREQLLKLLLWYAGQVNLSQKALQKYKELLK